MKEVLIEVFRNDRSYGYCPTKGVDKTREFLADKINKKGHVQITSEDIIFSTALAMRSPGHTVRSGLMQGL